ncbi:hypothetical protein ABZW18_18825 [Streptomyces sp. NPDC004647]|uniref:hypothetical protein n=1 Tax=Streptomyces sp. NPDC004647 TaxID=3154671 RepID=UPI0033B8462E
MGSSLTALLTANPELAVTRSRTPTELRADPVRSAGFSRPSGLRRRPFPTPTRRVDVGVSQLIT